MFPIESFQNTLLKITVILQEQDIPFHLAGGVMGVAYGEQGFSSNHNMGCNFVFADGSTRFLDKDIDDDMDPS